LILRAGEAASLYKDEFLREEVVSLLNPSLYKGIALKKFRVFSARAGRKKTPKLVGY